MDDLQRINFLVDELNTHNYNYYTLDNPTISDAQYDKLYYELVDLQEKNNFVPDNSPTRRVGGEILSGFKSYRHKHKLYSLDKCQSFEEFDKWVERCKKTTGEFPEASVEYKFDGLTIVLTYEGGKLVLATTRGNGEVGEVVTEQIKTIRTVPLEIPFKGYVEVQGEGIMRLSALRAYNKIAKESLKNARNGVAGAIRNLDTSETAKRKLDVFCYNVNYIEDTTLSSQEEILKFLKENRFLTSKFFKIAKSENEVKDFISEIENERENLDFLIDGAVIKINELHHRDELGYTEKFPRWAVAFKYKSQEETTVLKEVIWQVSRTGKLNPLAILEPVDIGGATVSKATLNNYNDILKKGVKVGATVLIRRSNDVIPEIMGVVEEDENCIEILPPEVCPYCGSKVVSSGAFIKCPNIENCAPAVISSLSHFASKDAMDIEGLSDKTLELLYDERIIRNIYDIYYINATNLEHLEGFKDKKISNLINNIAKSKQTTLSRFLYAMGIDNVGKKSARMLADKFRTLDAVALASKESLLEIDDFGEIMAESVVKFFESDKNKLVTEKLLGAGICIEEEKENVEGKFYNMTLVLTGSLQSLTRGEASKIITREGGKTSDSVSKKVDLVVVGADAGSKLEKANKLGVKVISEDEFLRLIND